MKNLTLIKLGGSVITDKTVPMVVRQANLTRLVKEIAAARLETGEVFIVGHGQGSFAHVPAEEYRTMDGFINNQSRLGMAVTQDLAAQLNRIVIKAFLAEQLPAVSLAFSNQLVTTAKQPLSWNGAVLDEYLDQQLLPITYGDVIVDHQQGCTIWSTEDILNFLAQELGKKDYQIKKIIHVTDVDGVLDQDGQVIPEISIQQKDDIDRMVGKAKGIDVTGGMKHKLEESLHVAKVGIQTYIISGLRENNLYHLLTNKPFIGTLIQK